MYIIFQFKFHFVINLLNLTVIINIIFYNTIYIYSMLSMFYVCKIIKYIAVKPKLLLKPHIFSSHANYNGFLNVKIKKFKQRKIK